jgi:hypothetical protein
VWSRVGQGSCSCCPHSPHLIVHHIDRIHHYLLSTTATATTTSFTRMQSQDDPEAVGVWRAVVGVGTAENEAVDLERVLLGDSRGRP